VNLVKLKLQLLCYQVFLLYLLDCHYCFSGFRHLLSDSPVSALAYDVNVEGTVHASTVFIKVSNVKDLSHALHSLDDFESNIFFLNIKDPLVLFAELNLNLEITGILLNMREAQLLRKHFTLITLSVTVASSTSITARIIRLIWSNYQELTADKRMKKLDFWRLNCIINLMDTDYITIDDFQEELAHLTVLILVRWNLEIDFPVTVRCTLDLCLLPLLISFLHNSLE